MHNLENCIRLAGPVRVFFRSIGLWVLCVGLMPAGTAQTQVGDFQRLVAAIDEHLKSFSVFYAADPEARARADQDLREAELIRQHFHETGEVPVSRLVQRIVEGYNVFRMGPGEVRVFLPDDPFGPDLECDPIVFRKRPGVPSGFGLIGGSREFWLGKSQETKFASGVFRLPPNERTLEIHSGSFSMGKVIRTFEHTAEFEQWCTRPRQRHSGMICECRLDCTYTLADGESISDGSSIRELGCCAVGGGSLADEECRAMCEETILRKRAIGYDCKITNAVCKASDHCKAPGL